MALPAAEALQRAAAVALQGQRGAMRTHGQCQGVQEPGLAGPRCFPDGDLMGFHGESTGFKGDSMGFHDANRILPVNLQKAIENDHRKSVDFPLKIGDVP